MASAAKAQATSVEIANLALDHAKRQGAQEAAATATRSRDVEVRWRDGKLEKVAEATERALALQLYVDGRYSSVTTSDLRPEAIAAFVKDAIALARALVVDKDRRLPEPELYQGQAALDLELDDPAQNEVTPDERKRHAAEIEAGARAVPGAEAILSVTATWNDGWVETERLASNGFQGARRETYYYDSASVSVKDKDGRPEDFAYQGRRFRGDLTPAEAIGREAAQRALARMGSTKGKSAKLVAVVENRAAGRLVGLLGQALAGQALQQKRSFLEGKLGERLGSKLFNVSDHPHIARGLGSRLWDGEGMAARKRTIVEDGVLRSYFLDTYYARKLGVAPTTASPTNLAWTHGEKDQAGILRGVKDGILITGFLGGNSNAATGDFSLGVRGHRIRRGQKAEPIGEMNIAGNHLELWKRLVAVGNDPFISSALRTPTLVFEAVHFAGV